VVVDTNRAKGQLFKTSEAGGGFYIYDVDVGFISNDLKKLGETRSLHDALELIKASVEGTVRNVCIEDW
jgi:hypothetical protein